METKNAALEAQKADLEAQNAALKVQNAELKAQIAQLLVRNEGTAAYVTELQSCIAMQKRALEAQRQNFEAQCQNFEAQCRELEAQCRELEAQYKHIIASMSQEMCQQQSRNEELSMETSELLKSLQSLHDPRSWIISSADPEISTLSMVLSGISPNVEKVKRIRNELEKLRTIIPEYLTSSNASTEQVLQQLLGDQERLCAEQRDLEGKILPCEEVVGPLLRTIFHKVTYTMMDGEE